MGPIYKRIGKGVKEPLRQEEASVAALRAIMRPLRGASCRGRVTGACGETMEIYLKIKDDRVEDATFFTDGCQCSVICACLATHLSKGKTVDEAIQIGGDTLLMILNSLPESETHCAFLAAETLHAAIHDWMLTGRAHSIP